MGSSASAIKSFLWDTYYVHIATINLFNQLLITSAKQPGGGYVFVVVCLYVCLLATLRKNFQTDLHEIFREG